MNDWLFDRKELKENPEKLIAILSYLSYY